MSEEKIEQLLRELATQLGTTGEHLWKVMIKQAFISAISDITSLLIGALLTLIFYVLASKSARKENKILLKDDGIHAPLIIFSSFFGLLTFLFFLINISPIVTSLFNPEYWALNEILRRF